MAVHAQTSSDFRFELGTQSLTHVSLWDMVGTFNALISGSYPDVPCASSPVTRVSLPSHSRFALASVKKEAAVDI